MPIIAAAGAGNPWVVGNQEAGHQGSLVVHQKVVRLGNQEGQEDGTREVAHPYLEEGHRRTAWDVLRAREEPCLKTH